MNHFQFAVASIVDANTGFVLSRNAGSMQCDRAEARAREIRARSILALVHPVSGAIKNWLKSFRERMSERRAISQLSQLNDHFLDDIGLTRGDIAAADLGYTSLVQLDEERRERFKINGLKRVQSNRIDLGKENVSAANQDRYELGKCA